MDRWYVTIDHLTDDQLEFIGYVLIKENDEFKVYRDYSGTEHIVSRRGTPYLYVDDINDAAAIRSGKVVPAPTPSDD